MPISPAAAGIRARIAGKKRQDPNADVFDDQRELKVTLTSEYLRKVIPHFTRADRRYLASILLNEETP